MEGDSFEERYSQYVRLVEHAERLWVDSAQLFIVGSYPIALFLAIVCLEEIGKISVARFHMCMPSDALTQLQKQGREARKRTRNPFYAHTKKHLLAAGAGALVNARLDRIIGLETVQKFLDDAESGELEKLRQACLYVDFFGDGVHLPYANISRNQALTYIVLAGECLAEALGFAPDEWQRLLERVKEFEKSVGMLFE